MKLMPSSHFPRLVVVGAGFAGLQLTRALGNEPLRITLLDKQNHHLFQPLLYQVATAGLTPSAIASPIRSILRNQNNVDVVLAEVASIDPQAKTVTDTRGNIYPFDYLVVATGAKTSYFGHKDWEVYAPGLKDLSDATWIREKILTAFENAETETDLGKQTEWLRFVLVGGGPTGVEMAGAIAELSHRALASDFTHIDPRLTKIVLIEAGPRILSTFSEDLSYRAARDLNRLGVEVMTGVRVEKIDDSGVWFGGIRLASKTVIWTAGVQATPVAEWLKVPADKMGRVLVNADLSVQEFSNIYVIGDAACFMGLDGRPLPGVAPVAMQQGRFVAGEIKKKVSGGHHPAVFQYFDKGNLATVGRNFAVVQIGGFKLAGFFAWWTWLVIHIFYLIGFRNRLLVLIEWAWSYFTFQRGARLILRQKK